MHPLFHNNRPRSRPRPRPLPRPRPRPRLLPLPRPRTRTRTRTRQSGPRVDLWGCAQRFKQDGNKLERPLLIFPKTMGVGVVKMFYEFESAR